MRAAQATLAWSFCCGPRWRPVTLLVY